MKGNRTEIGKNHWRLRVYIGEGRQRSRNFRGTAKEADKVLRDLVNQVEGRRDNGPRSVADLLDAWLEHLEVMGKARPYTIQGYRYAVDGALKPAFGHHRLDLLTARHLDQQYARWLGEGVAPGTVLTRHRYLSAALRQAVKWDWIGEAVTAKATPPSPADPDPRSMDPEEIRVLIEEAEGSDPVLATAIALAAATGCRRGELVGLRWHDWVGGDLIIARSITVTGSTYHVNQTKTNRVRRIALDEYGARLLGMRQMAQVQLAADAEVKLAPDPYFLSRWATGSEPVRPESISKAFRRTCDKLRLPYHFHELRHWSATTQLVDGIDPRTVAGRLGHANPAITMRIYAKFIESADQKAAASLGQALTRRS